MGGARQTPDEIVEEEAATQDENECVEDALLVVLVVVHVPDVGEADPVVGIAGEAGQRNSPVGGVAAAGLSPPRLPPPDPYSAAAAAAMVRGDAGGVAPALAALAGAAAFGYLNFPGCHSPYWPSSFLKNRSCLSSAEGFDLCTPLLQAWPCLTVVPL